jgi:ABC-type multidrug transport system fused ATPase/permease subunit
MKKEKFKENLIVFLYFKRILKKFGLYFFLIILLSFLNSILYIDLQIFLKKIINILAKEDFEENILKKNFYIYLGILFSVFAINRANDFLSNNILNTRVKKLIFFDFLFVLFSKKNYLIEKNDQSLLTTKIQNSSFDFAEIVYFFIRDILEDFFFIIITLTVGFGVNLIFFLIFISYISISFLISFVFIKKILFLSENFNKSINNLLEKFSINSANLVLIKIFQIGDLAKQKLNNEIDHIISKDEKKLRVSENFLYAAQVFLFSSVMSILVFFLIKLKIQNKITIGDFSLITSICISIANRIWSINKRSIRISNLIGKLKENLKVLSPGILENFEETQNENSVFCNHLSDIKEIKKVQIKNLCFSYNSGNLIFSNFSLIIDFTKNNKICFVGDSSSGKTTLIKLFLKIFKPDDGEIYLNEKNINCIDDENFYSLISAHLNLENFINISVFENLAFNSMDQREWSEILKLLNKFQIDSFIENLEKQYDTKIENESRLFSDEMKQIFGLIRVFLRKKSNLIILDEPTKHITSKNLDMTYDLIFEYLQNKNLLAISNDLNFVLKMDFIYFFENGKIVEFGNPSDLLVKEGCFKRFFSNNLDKNCFLQEKNIK